MGGCCAHRFGRPSGPPPVEIPAPCWVRPPSPRLAWPPAVYHSSETSYSERSSYIPSEYQSSDYSSEELREEALRDFSPRHSR